MSVCGSLTSGEKLPKYPVIYGTLEIRIWCVTCGYFLGRDDTLQATTACTSQHAPTNHRPARLWQTNRQSLFISPNYMAGRSSISFKITAFAKATQITYGLREIYVDTLVSTLSRQGGHKRKLLITLRREKQVYLSERHTRVFSEGRTECRILSR